ncbi:HNH endonuclease [candidate division WOR-3 bacterium]|nr:HNH endonuclease [candidate division WOR-3 bacterium]
MAFKKKEVSELLVKTNRRCCLCETQHDVQVHHIIPLKDGGTDDIDNAITLCIPCHHKIHPENFTKSFTPDELKGHRQRMIEKVARQKEWAPGNTVWKDDKKLILFYAQCLDRPAFHTRFHCEMSFQDFDRAMEDTLHAINTDYRRTQSGLEIPEAKGKVFLVHQAWREKLDQITEIIEKIRIQYRHALGFVDSYGLDFNRFHRFDRMMDKRLRDDSELGELMNNQRQEIIDIMNSILKEIDHKPLRGIRY